MRPPDKFDQVEVGFTTFPRVVLKCERNYLPVSDDRLGATIPPGKIFARITDPDGSRTSRMSIPGPTPHAMPSTEPIGRSTIIDPRTTRSFSFRHFPEASFTAERISRTATTDLGTLYAGFVRIYVSIAQHTWLIGGIPGPRFGNET